MGKEKNVFGMAVFSLLLLSLLFSTVASAERIDVSADEAYKMLQEKPDDIILLDVRTEMIYNSEHITGANYNVVNIPLGVLESRLSELDKSKAIIAYCQAGRASSLASDILLQNGFERVFMMVGGINAWREKYSTSLTAQAPTQAPTSAIEAPSFTLTSIDGTTFSLSDYSGKVVVLTLISTTCGLCNEEMQELVQLRQANPEAEILTVSVNPLDTDEILRDFKEIHNADWTFARDTDNVFFKYQAYRAATPTIVIITPQGYLSFRKVEVVPLEDLKSAVESAYSEEGALIPTATPEEEPQIPGFEATSAIVIVGVLVVSQWMVKRKKS
ncbi:MAG TPA: rhodanese-like domain-containing protein [Candidatus Bathyarchaeia archaeon]|nr:rhodanese-like domain-containing protein [Candidatus Bathyarchaeia archaeon]